MKLSKIFNKKPEYWGTRGDPYFWDYLKKLADNKDMISPEELETWIKDEYYLVSGEIMTGEDDDIVYVEEFAHGGMSSGELCGRWWITEGIPLLKSRLNQ